MKKIMFFLGTLCALHAMEDWHDVGQDVSHYSVDVDLAAWSNLTRFWEQGIDDTPEENMQVLPRMADESTHYNAWVRGLQRDNVSVSSEDLIWYDRVKNISNQRNHAHVWHPAHYWLAFGKDRLCALMANNKYSGVILSPDHTVSACEFSQWRSRSYVMVLTNTGERIAYPIADDLRLQNQPVVVKTWRELNG